MCCLRCLPPGTDIRMIFPIAKVQYRKVTKNTFKSKLFPFQIHEPSARHSSRRTGLVPIRQDKKFSDNLSRQSGKSLKRVSSQIYYKHRVLAHISHRYQQAGGPLRSRSTLMRYGGKTLLPTKNNQKIKQRTRYAKNNSF